MKKYLISFQVILFVVVLLLSNSFAQNYVHYATLTGHKGWVQSVSFSPDGQTLASGSSSGGTLDSLVGIIHIWDVGTGKHLRTLTGHTFRVNSVSFSPDGNTLAKWERGPDYSLVGCWHGETPTHPHKAYGVRLLAYRLVRTDRHWQAEVLTILFVYGMLARGNTYAPSTKAYRFGC